MSEPVLISPKSKDLGDGFVVRRALPAIERRHVGPFIFLDEMGPVTFGPGQGLDVRPHPHIGLATVTYLFDGAIEHRDSLGTVQVIRPGDVNWMTSGRGIVHSERSPNPRMGDRLHGIQFWVALPQDQEEVAPAFLHYPGADLPKLSDGALTATILMGAMDGHASPVRTPTPMLYLDLHFAGAHALPWRLPADQEKAVYVVDGAVRVDDITVQAGQLLALPDFAAPRVQADGPARAILFGGAPLDGPRKMWWNFVSSRPERIEQAKADWRAQAMGVVPGETEFIPLPEH